MTMLECFIGIYDHANIFNTSVTSIRPDDISVSVFVVFISILTPRKATKLSWQVKPKKIETVLINKGCVHIE